MAKAIPKNIETRLFINGEFVESSDGKKFDVFSPFSREKIASGKSPFCHSRYLSSNVA